ncbi:ATP-binding protein [Candidatus Oleimmundimicrobium sp.]|uniref:ATP-binding protein n=1 Tax=Candidatus Oleimmundimicrobium sp. TaxID=3060597 RepID=UPI0027220C94|nr:ATP-binding protein [Candidatus Oleimmundimicrobium sp.]MDO8885426.1 ATP-binding protein [Candidatus Oleimmundimicrobium sp.]
MSSKKTDELINFIEGVTGDKYQKVEEYLGNGFVRLNISEAEKRQAKHDIRSVEDVVVELIRNSRDAGCKNIFIAFHKEKNDRNIVIVDDGCGIPSNLVPKIFEPRVTSKLDSIVTDKYGIHGRGMALYAIKNNTEEINVVMSAANRGSIIKVNIDTTKLPERKDQSTLPVIKIRHGEAHVTKGPHNILRLLVEFCIEHQEIKVFFGFPTQVLATMYYLSQNLLNSNKGGKAVFLENFEKGSLPLWQCLGCIGSVNVLAETSNDYYGLDVSKRNVNRIFSGDVEPLDDLYSALFKKGKKREIKLSTNANFNYPSNLVKYIQKDDLDKLSCLVEEEFGKIGKKYFLYLKNPPKILREKNQIKIVLEVEGEE